MITSFSGDYRFLSNFWAEHGLAERLWGYPTIEHYYQAMKSTDMEYRAQVKACSSPVQAKRMGNMLFLRKGWDDMRLDVMRVGLEHKFSAGTRLAEKLLDTGEQPLVEGNYWHDNFWGNCTCKKCQDIEGQNHLGKLLMGQRFSLLTGGKLS